MRMNPEEGRLARTKGAGSRTGRGGGVREVPRRDRDGFFVQHICDIFL